MRGPARACGPRLVCPWPFVAVTCHETAPKAAARGDRISRPGDVVHASAPALEIKTILLRAKENVPSATRTRDVSVGIYEHIAVMQWAPRGGRGVTFAV